MEIVNDLKEKIRLNKLEALTMLREYIFMYIISFKNDFNGKDNREILLEKLKEYFNITREENSYLRFLLVNIDKVCDEVALNKVLDDLDVLNENTYKYYDSILKEYEDNLFCGNLERKFVPTKSFKTILETSAYLEEVLGLTLSLDDLEEYFERSDVFSFLQSKTKIFGEYSDNGMDLYGCFPQIDKNTGIITDLKICVPKITSLKSMCINIHEYKHGIDLLPYLGKKMPSDDLEKKAKLEVEKFKIYLKSRKN